MVSQNIRFQVFKRDNFRCQYCGKTGEGVILEVDHITPVFKGGNNDIGNLITSCRECNRGKSTIEVVKSNTRPSDDKRVKIINETCETLREIDYLKLKLKELYEKNRENDVNYYNFVLDRLYFKATSLSDDQIKLEEDYDGETPSDYRIHIYKLIGYFEGELDEIIAKSEIDTKIKLDAYLKGGINGK